MRVTLCKKIVSSNQSFTLPIDLNKHSKIHTRTEQIFFEKIFFFFSVNRCVIVFVIKKKKVVNIQYEYMSISKGLISLKHF